MGTTTQLAILIALFFSVYGSIHLYVYRRVMSQANFPAPVHIVVGIFFILMVVSPVLCRVWKGSSLTGSVYLLTLASSLWMGFVFYLFLVHVAIDLTNTSGKLLSLIGVVKTSSPVIPKGYPLLLLTFLVVITICCYAYFEALDIGVSEVVIETPKLQDGVSELVIAQISDVHLGVLVDRKRLLRMIEILMEINPDILVSTGDLVDENMDSMKDLEKELRRIHPKFGKYAVTGNHEFYAGIERSIRFIEDSGFQLLRNQYLKLDGLINLIGIDDPAAKRYGKRVGEKSSVLLSKRDPGLFTILLFHRPREVSEGNSSVPIDLQLSGHTHKGQLFPFNLVTGLFYPFQGGFFEMNGGRLYASRGTGTWGPPLRFISPPEIVVIRLKNAKM